MTIQTYLNNISQRYKLGNATEHTFRGDLQQLLESLVPTISATNEPKRQSCGAPDYILTKKDNLSREFGIPVGFIEAKDIGDKDLEGAKKTGNKEQFDRYKASLNNLIFTDYLDFHLYIDGVFITKIAIAKLEFPSTNSTQASHGKFPSNVKTPASHGEFPSHGGVPNGRGGTITPLPQNFATFTNLINNFCSHIGQTIKSPKKLAEMMAGKARLLSDVIERALTSDENNHNDSTLKEQMLAFKEILIHDITPKGFADVYAQTIAYGMFAARLHDPTLPTFSRQEAAELIPKTNPFLRKLFGYIAGPDIDDRIKWIVDSLVEIFLACDVADILKNYGKTTKMEDPIIHFYETFLSEYDPKLRKARGVWYTPAPVVNFIVRAVDDILKTEFDLPQGLADTSKTTIPFPSFGGVPKGRGGREVHKVQILDPATGTGTFLAEVVKHIHKKFEGQQGIWSQYVENHLLPRLIGFELLMASYAMAHLQLDLLLTETGYKPSDTFPSFGDTPASHGEFPSFGGVPNGRGGSSQRLRVYLTNSLEESHPDTGTLFANWLSTEANEANHIKRDSPVMCIIGNPPYSGESANKGEWIMSLMEDYKKEPGGIEKLKERNPKWINDDYVKFLRYGQHFIEKNGSGILAFINPHGFLDNPTFRGMRWNLLKTYDKIYTIDLHGNAKKKETCPDGSADVNVFDIEQGVSINIFVKTGKKKANELGKVFHYDLYGKRELKYDFLTVNSLKTIDYKELPSVAPNYFFVSKNFDEQKVYDKGFKLNEFFTLNNVGIVTSKDAILINGNKDELIKNVEGYYNIEINKKLLKNISYRPFDDRFIYYDTKIIERARDKVMQHLFNRNNLALNIKRQCKLDFSYCFITNKITESCLFESAYANNSVLPLYLYPETNVQQTIGQTTTPPVGHPSEGGECRTPNLNTEIVNQIANKIGLTFVPEKKPSHINAIHSPPLEGCPQGGVVLNNPQGGVVNNTHPTAGVVHNTPQNKVVIATINNTPIYRNFVENLPHNPKLNQLAKDKRKAGILSEVLFWQQVHKGKFHNLDFDRQRIIGNYIVDFYIKTLGLIIEIDGNSHDNKQEYDAARQIYLENHGLKLYRILDWDVKQGLRGVMIALEDYIIKEFGEKNIPTSGSDSVNNVGKKNTPVFDHQSIGGECATPPVGHPSKGGELSEEFAPIDILDYIYAVLHSPTYREKYKEFLKIDFPRVPYPKDADTFWELVNLGGEIRQIHLLESPTVEKYITQYPIDGDNVVTKPVFVISPQHNTEHPTQKNTEHSPQYNAEHSPKHNGEHSPPLEGCPQGGVVNTHPQNDVVNTHPQNQLVGKVFINETQYFDNVPQTAWDFYIGGYQPAQKWLKDRKTRTLEFEDILHYQKIIVALTETDRLMKEIDKIEIE